MTPEKIRAEQAKLNAAAAGAEKAWRESRDPAGRSPERVGVMAGGQDTALKALCAHHHNVTVKREVANPKRARQRSMELAKALADGTLILLPRDPQNPEAGVWVLDPRPSAREEELRQAKETAQLDRDRFRAEHVETIAAADRNAVMERYRRAVEGNDPYELAAAQKALPTIPDVNTLTTEDL